MDAKSDGKSFLVDSMEKGIESCYNNDSKSDRPIEFDSESRGVDLEIKKSNSISSRDHLSKDVDQGRDTQSISSARTRLLEAQITDVEFSNHSHALETFTAKILDNTCDDGTLLSEIDDAINNLRYWRSKSAETGPENVSSTKVKSLPARTAHYNNSDMQSVSDGEFNEESLNGPLNSEVCNNLLGLIQLEKSKLSGDIKLSNTKLAEAMHAANSLESTMRSPRYDKPSFSIQDAQNKKVEIVEANIAGLKHIEDEVRDATYAERLKRKDETAVEDFKLQQDMDQLEAQLREFSSKIDSLL